MWDTFVMENLEFPFLRQLNVGFTDFIETNLIHIVKTSHALKSITIRSGGTVVHEVLQQIADHCPLLEELETMCSFLFDDLLYLLNKSSALTKLSLRGCSSSRWKDSDWERLRPYGHLMHEISVDKRNTAFVGILDACPRLSSLEYSDVENENHGMILLRASQSCPLLEVLSFDTHSTVALFALSRNCKKLGKVIITHSSPPLSITDLAIFNQIETLENLTLHGPDLTNEHLAVISGFRNLTELCFDYHNDAIFLKGTFTGTPISQSLETISFYEGGGVVPVAILSCLSPCKNLREIDLNTRFCDDAGFKILATHFPLLKEITMGYVKEHIVGLTYFLTQHKHLKTVYLFSHRDSNDEEVNASFQDHFTNHVNDLRSYFPHIQFQFVPFL